MTMMPFMGVRISWLIMARNSDLVRAAASAASLAARSSASCFLAVVMSLTATNMHDSPSRSRTAAVTLAQKVRPPHERPTASKLRTMPSRRKVSTRRSRSCGFW